MFHTEQIATRNAYLTLRASRVSPHSLIFLALNCLYFIPILGVFFFNYSEGGTITLADLDAMTLKRTIAVYLAGIIAFLLGSGTAHKPALFLSNNNEVRILRRFEIRNSFWAITLVVIAGLLISKVLLIPEGVYAEYAFDTQNMTSGMWNFSMFCSESLLLLSIALLFSTHKHNVRWFLALSAVDATNLLHGTRVFFMIAGLTLCFYAFLRRKLNWRVAVALVLIAISIGYVVFLSRSNAVVDTEALSPARLISPIMYESIFSQLSLFEAVRSPQLWDTFGSPHNLLLDTFYFLVPRFLFPDKDQALFIDRFGDLSPLGAFSGYAQGLIYLGFLFPLFYFVLGRIAAWLFRRAETSGFWAVGYVYFVCDSFFRIMRDGYIIPIKMLINGLTILALMAVLDRGFNFLSGPAPADAMTPDFSGHQGFAHE